MSEPIRIIPSMRAADGAGVQLRRSLGASAALRHDPFLLLDEFNTDDAQDPNAGFPPHPHRGFETVTYLLRGQVRHEDSLGNHGELGPGDVQWMTAGRGIIHSEMPGQNADSEGDGGGFGHGFQLWVNLPAAEKMQPPHWQDIPAPEIPEITAENGVRIKVISGSASTETQTVTGPVSARSTRPVYLDVFIPAGEAFSYRLPEPGMNALLYPYSGSLKTAGAAQQLPLHACALYSDPDEISVIASDSDARLLLIAGRPIGEPVKQYGPFVMNSSEEIEQALADFRDGKLVSDPS